MKIVSIAVAVMVFTAVVIMFNTLNIFDQKTYVDPINQINMQGEASGIFEVDSPSVSDKEGITDQIADALGFEALFKIIDVVKKALGIALNLGGLFAQYVPGVVGEQMAILINALTYFVYAWGGVQLWRKVSTKQMD